MFKKAPIYLLFIFLFLVIRNVFTTLSPKKIDFEVKVDIDKPLFVFLHGGPGYSALHNKKNGKI